MRSTVAIFGIPIDNLNTEQTLERIEEFIQTGRFHQIATANTDFLIKAYSDPELKSILREADLVAPDGMPVVLASKLLGASLKERVTGADIVPQLAELAEKKGYRIFMLGARPEVALAAKEALQKRHPRLQIVGCISPPNTHIINMDSQTILDRLEAAAPDILLVAFGCPKQEKWIHMHRHRLKVPACIGVGGTFDFIAGSTPRAPVWMRNSGLEWLHRLISDPKRLWKRYAHDFFSFTHFMALHLWVMRRSANSIESRIAASQIGSITVLSLVGSMNESILLQFQTLAEAALKSNQHLIMDFLSTTDIDSAFLGTLINLAKRARYVSRDIRLIAISDRVRHALQISGVLDILPEYTTFTDAFNGHVSESFEILLQKTDNSLNVRMMGSMDGNHVTQIEDVYNKVKYVTEAVQIDLTPVTYLDCAAIKALNDLVHRLSSEGIRVSLVFGKTVRDTFKRENISNLFNITINDTASDKFSQEISLSKQT
jgi:N-acetylglucosaminyldiphosphoundecaprenol N-acetyl-beta-D-mannosaminyltransferase